MDANGGANFEETSKHPLSELQLGPEELPGGVDPKTKEVWIQVVNSTLAVSINQVRVSIRLSVHMSCKRNSSFTDQPIQINFIQCQCTT